MGIPPTTPYERFRICAQALGEVQLTLLKQARLVFDEDDQAYVRISNLVGVGSVGWETRMIAAICGRIEFHFKQFNPTGSSQPAATGPKMPMLEIISCRICDAKINAISPMGKCCAGQQECPNCKFSAHEENCKSNKINQTENKPNDFAH